MAQRSDREIDRVTGVDTSDAFTLQGVLKLVFGFLGFAVVVYLLWYFSSVVIYILISALLAILFSPLVNLLTSLKVRGREITRGVAAIISLFAIWLIFGMLFSALVPLVFSKLYQLTNIDLAKVLTSVEEPILYVQHYIQHLFSLPESNMSLSESMLNWIKGVVDLKTLNSAFSSVMGIAVSSVISFFSISFITFFFLKDDRLFFSMVSSIFPDRYNDSVMRAMSSISNLLSRYFVGLLCESAIIATAVSLAMICFGMAATDALFIGLVMGVMNVIPYAGPFIGVCFSIFLGVMTPIEALGIGGTIAAIVVSLSVIKGFDDFVLQPTLYSERVKAHPLEVFLVILMSGYVAGVVGMLLAIPSYTVLRVFAKEFFSHLSLVRKLTKEL